MADAAYVILTKPSKEFSGNFCIDDTLLAENGVSDFSVYADVPFDQLAPDFFVPEDMPPPEAAKKKLKVDSISDDSSSWISSCFKTEETFSFSKLRTESSQRDYFRFNFQGKTFILMYAPKGIDESIESFCKKADVFKSFQVKVPEIYFRNDDLCHLIIEDFSDNLFQLNISQENSDIFIKSALDQLIRIQNIACDTEIFDHFDLEKSIANKDLFIDFFCRGYLNLSDSSIPFDTINEGYNFILKRFYEQPLCISHYDFETRNLIYLDSKETGVLDFQDAMIAPYALDLASIFKDLYVVWDKKQVDDWLDYYKKNTQNEEIKSLDDFKEDIEFCAMQRQIRILGKLSQVSITLNRDDRLNDFPVLINYLIDSMSRYKELKRFFEVFTDFQMKAFILCAGLGTRLRPISNQIPKCLVEVKGTSLLERHIRKLKEINVSEIIINLHHKPDAIKEFLNRKKNFEINITFSEEDTLMGTGGALIKAKEEIGTETFVLVSGDLYTEYPLERLRNKVDGAHLIAVKNNKSTGDFSINEGIVEEGTGFNYGGIALINPTLLVDRNKQDKEFWKDIILPAVKKKKVSAEIYEGILKNINTKEDLDFV